MWDYLRRRNGTNLVLTALASLNRKVEAIMATQAELKAGLDALKAKVEAQTTVIAGVQTLIGGLRQQIIDALNNAGSVDQTVIDEVNQIISTADQNAAGLAAALNANVPIVVSP